MSKKMLINAIHAEEARVAIVEDGRLVDLDVEIAGNEQIRGNIYKGVVVRVEPGLQAAFVDIGLKKLGFLQMGELHPENWNWRDDVPEDQRHRRPRIQEVLRRGQELIVQVEKGERDNKGSALTSYASLPGRYMVLMPGSDSSGISRKVEAEGERKKLKEIISEMTIPEGYGYIIRTEAMGRTREELQKDLDSLIALYEGIRAQGGAMKGAGLIYQESALIIRTIRDYFSADIDEVLVDSKDVYKDVRECLKEIDPQFEKLVKMHQEKRPIFSRYQLEEQIDLIYEKKVPLKSGGSIFIEPTEALVSIDVNSGKSTGEKGVEDTAFKTNMEAAEEAARQLRLRDLGGLIVIDFIDMRDRKHNAEVEKTLKAALKADKARVNVARISEFGLLEMSRQRIRQTLNQASTLECPHCDGRGKVKSVEAMALSFLRKVHASAAKGTVGEVVGSLPLEVAYYLLNRKRHELSQIESDYDIEVTVKGKPSYLLNQMELELVKREKVPQEEHVQERPQVRQPAKEEAAAPEAAADGRKKRKKGKAKTQPEVAPPVFSEQIPAAVADLVAVEPGETEPVLAVEGDQEEQKKKRRRKRKRGGKGASAEAVAGEAAAGEIFEEAPEHPVEVSGDLSEVFGDAEQGGEHAEGDLGEHPGEEAGAEAGEEVKKKRRRKRRRGGKSSAETHLLEASEGSAQEGTDVSEEVSAEGTPEGAQPAPVATVAGAEPKRKGRPARTRKQPAEAAEGEVSAAGETSAEAPVETTADGEQGPAEVAAPAKTARGRRERPAKTAPVTETAAPAAPVDFVETVPASEPVLVTDAVEVVQAAGIPEAGQNLEAVQEAKPLRGAKAPRAPKAPKAVKPAQQEGVDAVVEAVATEVGSPAAAPKKGRAKPKAQPATGSEPGALPAEDAPKKTRAPRKKKEETPV